LSGSGISDHLIQDGDTKKANCGTPADHSELLDFNVGNTYLPHFAKDSLFEKTGVLGETTLSSKTGIDVYHLNAIRYNAELDQITFSSNLEEIFIIDHSTTTKEAAK